MNCSTTYKLRPGISNTIDKGCDVNNFNINLKGQGVKGNDAGHHTLPKPPVGNTINQVFTSTYFGSLRIYLYEGIFLIIFDS